MTKVIIMRALLVCSLTLVAVAFAKPAEYTTKYDNIDLDEILKNKRLLNNYANCLLDKGTCTPDGLELKKVLPDALETDCAKCSEKQKDGSKKVLNHLLRFEPNTWTDVEKKYDPTGDYKKKYCARAKDDGVDVEDSCS